MGMRPNPSLVREAQALGAVLLDTTCRWGPPFAMLCPPTSSMKAVAQIAITMVMACKNGISWQQVDETPEGIRITMHPD